MSGKLRVERSAEQKGVPEANLRAAVEDILKQRELEKQQRELEEQQEAARRAREAERKP